MKERKKKLTLKSTNIVICKSTEQLTIEGEIIGSEVLYHIPPNLTSEKQVYVESFYFGIFDEENKEMEEWWKWLYGLDSFPERNTLDVVYQIELKPSESQYEDFSFTMKFITTEAEKEKMRMDGKDLKI